MRTYVYSHEPLVFRWANPQAQQTRYAQAHSRENGSNVAQPSTSAKICQFCQSGHGTIRSALRSWCCHKSTNGSWSTWSGSASGSCAFQKGTPCVRVQFTIKENVVSVESFTDSLYGRLWNKCQKVGHLAAACQSNKCAAAEQGPYNQWPTGHRREEELYVSEVGKKASKTTWQEKTKWRCGTNMVMKLYASVQRSVLPNKNV